MGLKNPALAPLIVRKKTDEAVTSDTTVQNDNELFFSLPANSIWFVWLGIICNGATAGDLKFSISVPAGATGVLDGAIKDPGGVFGNYNGDLSLFANLPLMTSGTGATQQLIWEHRGVVVNGSTVGNFQLQWAQNASSATATSVLANSFIYAYRIG